MFFSLLFEMLDNIPSVSQIFQPALLGEWLFESRKSPAQGWDTIKESHTGLSMLFLHILLMILE